MDGLLRCSKYSFGPNRLHYCGPDANREILGYIQSGASDLGLKDLMKAFKTLFPYLKFIAAANSIRDPFDNRVVEAYWLGNELLETVEKKNFYRHLLEDHELKKRIGNKAFEEITAKISEGAVPHHSFHVFNVWKRTGHLERAHTVESMDSCRIGWGKVEKIDGPSVFVSSEPLIYENGKILLSTPITKKIIRNIGSDFDIEQLKIGDIITMHWNVPCEVITPRQAMILKKYTLKHLKLANETI